MDGAIHNGVDVHGIGQANGQPAGPPPNLRIPTVHEALPYSPFSSIIPFSPDVVPPPLAYPSTSTSVFPSQEQYASARRMLESLDLEAGNAERASERLQRTVTDLQRLLHSSSITNYQFKTPALPSSNTSRSSHTASGGTPAQASQHPRVTPFAKMVLDNTAVAHWHASPTTVLPHPRTIVSSATSAQKPAAPIVRPTNGKVPHPVVAPLRNTEKVSAPRTAPPPQDCSAHPPAPQQPISSTPRVEVRVGGQPTSLATPITSAPSKTNFQHSQHRLSSDQRPAVANAELRRSQSQHVHERVPSAQTNRAQNGAPPLQKPSQSSVAVIIPPRNPSMTAAVQKAPYSSSTSGSTSSQQAMTFKVDPTDHQVQVKQPGVYPQKLSSQDTIRPSQEPLRSSQTEVKVVIPRALTDAERASYKPYPEDEHLAAAKVNGLSKAKQPAEPATDQHLTTVAYDQREKSNTAVIKLQGLILDILEAEDQLQPDTSGVQSRNAARFFQVEDGADLERPILQPQIQSQLDIALQKVVNNGRFANVDVEQLGRIMKLCENVITAASSASLRIDEDTFQDVDDWTRRITLGEQGLFGCRSLLRIMTAGREEKQLYSEDTLRNLLNLVAHLVETCIIPIVEMRSDAGDAFKVASTQHKILFPLITQAGRVLKLLGELLLKTDVDESAITSAEYICKTLVFVENANSEKDAALGIQKFETIRLAAMDCLAKVFARHTDQRQFIFDEILTSLEKLPVSRQSARQFKLIDGKPIQLVSALLMRLVQTSATRSQTREKKTLDKKNNEASDEQEDSDEDAEGESEDESDYAGTKRPSKKLKKANKVSSPDVDDNLQSLAGPLYLAANHNASYMINYLLQRAMTSTKSGDQPYRNLLDIFTEDFIIVLGNTDWPAAEMLLRTLLAKLLEIMKDHKSSAPSKSMSLELLGSMATRITELRSEALKMAKHAQSTDNESEVTTRLLDLHESILTDDLSEPEMLAFDGPYRIVLEYLHLRDNNDSQLQTARGYHVMQWSRQTFSIKEPSTRTRELEKRLVHVTKDSHWLEDEYDFPRVSTEDGKFASVLITLYLPFCRAFNHIFTLLLSSMGGDQASLRSKSLKSIEQLLDKDPAILDRGNSVMANITKCLADTSTQVRDSALGLITKCLVLRPRLETEVCDKIIQRSHDNNIHVRKRAMKMLKDIYLRNSHMTLRSRIADALILRIVDTDDSVVELARHTFEDIWMVPFYSASNTEGENVRAKLRLQEQTALVVNIANEKVESADKVLAELVQGVLSPEKSKNAASNFNVCSQMVKMMFEGIIDSNELPGSPSQHSVLNTLTIFASASAKLFTPDQLQTLQPYIKNLSKEDNLLVYRCAIVILRHTLPHMRNLNKDFLSTLQTSLITSFQKLPKAELKEVAACLWMLDGELKNTEKLVRITASVLANIKKLRAIDTSKLENAVKTRRLVTIGGAFVQAFSLDITASIFKEQFPEYKGNSVASLAVDVICPFTSPKQPEELREAALESVSMICQAWPNQLMRADVCSAFELVFKSGDRKLEFILILGLKEFFSAGDKPGDGNAGIQVGAGIAAGEERLGNTYVATDRDSASTTTAQRFLHSILRVALASADELALNAAQVVASINRQGLVHPKESGPCLVALETCPDNKISNVAFQEHRTLYHKHETMFEKEHMRSIQQAYDYQHDVIHDTLGYTSSPPAAKLHMFWEVLKTGTAKARKKFLSSVCTKLNFEPAKVDLTGNLPTHVDLTRFVVENLAFFDYNKLDELQHLTASLEKVVSDTGTGISHAIEVEVLRQTIESNQPMADVRMDHQMGNFEGDGPTQLRASMAPKVVTIEPSRLRQLTVCAQTLLLLWGLRTYLRRVWNLSRPAASRGRPTAAGKESTAVRAPQRIPNSTKMTEEYLAHNAKIIEALNSEDSQRYLCAEFAKLMAVDDEVKVDDNDDDQVDVSMAMNGVTADGYETPSEGSIRSSVGPGSGGPKKGKKRKSMGDSTANTPRKRGRPGKSATPSVAGKGSRKSKDLEDELGAWD